MIELEKRKRKELKRIGKRGLRKDLADSSVWSGQMTAFDLGRQQRLAVAEGKALETHSRKVSVLISLAHLL